MKRGLVCGLSALGVLAILGGGAAACGKKQDDSSKKPPPPPGVVVTQVIQKDVPVFGEWIGTTAGDVNADIRPHITGYLLRRAYQEGGFVQQGQLLFEIDPRQFQAAVEQAQANLAQTQAQLAKDQRDVARYRPLAEQRAVSQQELDTAVAAEQVAAANVEAMRAALDQARLNLQWTRVTSPIAGVSGAAVAQVGDLVTPQSVLSTVSRVDPLRVQFNLSEQEYLHFREQMQADPAAAARFSSNLQLVLADGSVFPHPGKLIFTDRQVDVKTGTMVAVGLFSNPGNLLRPGQYGKIRAETALDKGALLVPQRAVNELQGGSQIAVVGADNKADVRNVQTGQRIGNLWVIDNGLHPAERVVVEGFSRVKTGAVVSPKEAPPAAAQAPAPPGGAGAPAGGATAGGGGAQAPGAGR
jgi:membrane fusion protein (multidrug efflux system)